MKLYTLILAMTLSSSLYAQTSDTTLTEVYRNDSVHTPVQLYIQDNIRLTVMYNELLKCSEVDSLNIVKDSLNAVRIVSLKEYNNALKELVKKKHYELAESNKKLKRNRKGFIIASGIIVATVALRIAVGI
jgi:hypothetical protein